MARADRTFLWTITPPLVSCMLLCAIVLEAQRRVKPESAEPFHHKASAVLATIGIDIRGPDGTNWTGIDTEVPAAATQLLKPNVIINRRYSETLPDGSQGRTADELIVQCRDARDMQGHYPPRCYPGNGDVLVSQRQRDWVMPDRPNPVAGQPPLPGITIYGMEYTFERSFGVDAARRIVYNFFVIPGQKQTARDIDAIYKVGEDYQARYFGSAQFQLVMPAQYTEAERDDVLHQLVGPYQDVILALEDKSGGTAQ